MNLFSIDTIALELAGYPLSYVEIIATLTGLVSVWLATRKRIATWPFGIVNEVGFFLIFFQVELYANMMLQVYFFIVSLLGWYRWHSPMQEKPVIHSSRAYLQAVAGILACAAVLVGFSVARLHLWLPGVFASAAGYPYLDSFVAVASMLAMWLMAHKRIECWLLWILVDLLSIYLYFSREVRLIAIEYVIFLLLACYGWHHWRTNRA
jgi:nicotinamide mononucleotide transporter